MGYGITTGFLRGEKVTVPVEPVVVLTAVKEVKRGRRMYFDSECSYIGRSRLLFVDYPALCVYYARGLTDTALALRQCPIPVVTTLCAGLRTVKLRPTYGPINFIRLRSDRPLLKWYWPT